MVFLCLNWCVGVPLWTLFPLCVYVGGMKEQNEQLWTHILVLCQNCQCMSERERREGEKVRWGDLGEWWRQMRRGVREQKWPCGPDADKLSALSALGFICHCHPAAFHPFLLLFLLFLFLSLHLLSIIFPPTFFPFRATYIYPPLSFVSSHAFTQLSFSCKKNPKPFTFLLFFKHTALHWMSHSRSHYFQERRCLLFFLHVGAKRCFVSRGAQICFLMFHWNMPWVVTLGHVCRERTIHFQYKACFANRLQMMFGVLAHCWLYMLIHADWWVLRANQVGMSTTFSSFL